MILSLQVAVFSHLFVSVFLENHAKYRDPGRRNLSAPSWNLQGFGANPYNLRKKYKATCCSWRIFPRVSPKHEPQCTFKTERWTISKRRMRTVFWNIFSFSLTKHEIISYFGQLFDTVGIYWKIFSCRKYSCLLSPTDCYWCKLRIIKQCVMIFYSKQNNAILVSQRERHDCWRYHVAREPEDLNFSLA